MDVSNTMETGKESAGGDAGPGWQLWLVAALLGLLYIPTLLWLLE